MLLVQFCVFISLHHHPKSNLSFSQKLQSCLGQIFCSPYACVIWYVCGLLLHVHLVHDMQLSQKCQSKFLLILSHGCDVFAISSHYQTRILHSYLRRICGYTSFNRSFNISGFLSKQFPSNVSPDLFQRFHLP